jgi:hypothetical protein
MVAPGCGRELHGLHHAGVKQETNERWRKTLGFGTSAAPRLARSFVA